MPERLSLMLTAAEAIWLIPFVGGCLFLAAVAYVRATTPTDPRDLVDRAHEWEGRP